MNKKITILSLFVFLINSELGLSNSCFIKNHQNETSCSQFQSTIDASKKNLDEITTEIEKHNNDVVTVHPSCEFLFPVNDFRILIKQSLQKGINCLSSKIKTIYSIDLSKQLNDKLNSGILVYRCDGRDLKISRAIAGVVKNTIRFNPELKLSKRRIIFNGESQKYSAYPKQDFPGLIFHETLHTLGDDFNHTEKGLYFGNPNNDRTYNCQICCFESDGGRDYSKDEITNSCLVCGAN